MNIIIKILCSSLVLVVQMVKNLPAMQETWVPSLDQEDPLEKGMATQTNILAWRIPWTEEPDGLQSMGSQRVGHDWATNSAIIRAHSLSPFWLFAILWTVACQAPLSMAFSRQKYWSGLPFPSTGALPDPGIEPMSSMSSSLAGRFFTTEPPGKPFSTILLLLSHVSRVRLCVTP